MYTWYENFVSKIKLMKNIWLHIHLKSIVCYVYNNKIRSILF